MARRFQARRGNGRFAANTMENTFGLHCEVCPYEDCRRLNPSPVGEPRLETCHACGRDLRVSAALAEVQRTAPAPPAKE